MVTRTIGSLVREPPLLASIMTYPEPNPSLSTPLQLTHVSGILCICACQATQGSSIQHAIESRPKA